MDDLRFLGERTQIAFVVRDIESAMRFWTQTMRVGPFVLIENSREPRVMNYRGKDTDATIKVAFAYMGDVQIEFIQPSNDSPSIYKEFLDSGKEGYHHIAFWPQDFLGACRRLESAGFVDVTNVRMASGELNVVYYETPNAVGTIVELVPLTPFRKSYFDKIHQLAKDWDGVTDPIRRFDDRAAFLQS